MPLFSVKFEVFSVVYTPDRKCSVAGVKEALHEQGVCILNETVKNLNYNVRVSDINKKDELPLGWEEYYSPLLLHPKDTKGLVNQLVDKSIYAIRREEEVEEFIEVNGRKYQLVTK